MQARDTSPENWVFTAGKDKVYELRQTDEDGRAGTFAVHLFKLKKHRFLDLYLMKLEGEGQKINAWANISLVPAHLLLKVEQIEPTLKLAAMNPDWMQKFLQRHPGALAHRLVSDDQVVLAAPTPELQKFILEHIDEDGFFGDAMEMKRK